MDYNEYRKTIDRYSDETKFYSFIRMEHFDYIALKKAGSEIVPYLIQDLREHTDHQIMPNCWAIFSLLREISGDAAPEIREGDRGRLDPIRQTWIEWYDAKQ